MANVQDVPGNAPDSGADPAANNADSSDMGSQPAATEDGSESDASETTRKRRRFKPEEIALAKRFIAMAPVGEPIPFAGLDRDMKQAVLPRSYQRTRLLDRGILEVEYDEENGLITSVSVNSDMLTEYEWDFSQPIPAAKATTTKAKASDGEPRQRKPRSILQDQKYKIRKLRDENPRRKNSHAFHNWNECYMDDISVPAYLSNMEYNRMIVTSNGTYFNGPSTLFLESDIKAGYLGVYDSTLPETNEDGSPNAARWLQWSDIEAAAPGTDDAEVTESDTDNGVEETAAEPAAA